jgi:glycosyltransferase involved in cell wall biosynthesis
MRVLIVVHGFPPKAQGGSEIYAEAHGLLLRRQYGDEVLVLTRDDDVTRPEYEVREEEHEGLRVVRINNTFRSARSFEETYCNETIDALSAGIIDQFRPDVAHIHHLTCLSTGIVRQLVARGIPRYLTMHDYWLICHRGQFLDVDYSLCDNANRAAAEMCARCLTPAARAAAGSAGRLLRAMTHHAPAPAALLRRGGIAVARFLAGTGTGPDAERRTAHMRDVCENITHFIAPSSFIRDRFVAFGIPKERITVADYGFDRAAFAAAERRPSHAPLRVGFLGSLMISKAPHVLLEAVRALRSDALSVTLYGAHAAYHGDDSYRRRITQLLEQPHVLLHGPLPHADVPRALASLDVLVVPSIWPENSPLVIHEAFLAGVPVVASRIGGITELVTDGVNGLLFPAGDVTGLACALERMVREPGLLGTLRAGIPAVRTLDEDVRGLREMYQRSRMDV